MHMSELNYSAHFTVKWRKEYRQNKEKKLTVEELGRIFRSNPLEIETWSKASGLPIPEVCRVPFVNPPKLLPLSLRIDRWVEDLENYFFDVTKGCCRNRISEYLRLHGKMSHLGFKGRCWCRLRYRFFHSGQIFKNNSLQCLPTCRLEIRCPSVKRKNIHW